MITVTENKKRSGENALHTRPNNVSNSLIIFFRSRVRKQHIPENRDTLLEIYIPTKHDDVNKNYGIKSRDFYFFNSKKMAV